MLIRYKMKAIVVIALFALIGVVVMGLMFEWSIKFCTMGSIVGTVWAIPYGMLIWKG